MLQRRILKTFALIAMNMYALPGFATAPGFYVGMMFGPSFTGAGDRDLQMTKPPAPPLTMRFSPNTKHKYAARFYMGNKISDYGGFEGGVTYITPIDYDTGDLKTCSSASAKIYYLDLLGKGTFQWRNLEIYGKAGAAAAYVSESGDFHPECKRARSRTFRPAAAVGVGYDLTQNWQLDASVNRAVVGGIVKNVSFVALSLSYHVVDQYCGQFLCAD